MIKRIIIMLYIADLQIMACFLLFKTTHAFFFAGGEVWGVNLGLF